MNPVFSFSTDFSGSVSCEMLNFDEWLSSSSPASECQDCHFLRRETLRLKEKLKILEKKERHLKVLCTTHQLLKDRLRCLEVEYSQQCEENNQLRSQAKVGMDKILLLENELEELKNNSNTMKRNESHAVEVIAPPPAPPPPSNSFFNFVGRKNSVRSIKTRSRSCSKIEDCRYPDPAQSFLSNDILDAIKNRKYSLRRIEVPRRASGRASADNIILEKLFQRRMRIEVSDDSDENVSGKN